MAFFAPLAREIFKDVSRKEREGRKVKLFAL